VCVWCVCVRVTEKTDHVRECECGCECALIVRVSVRVSGYGCVFVSGCVTVVSGSPRTHNTFFGVREE